jgi:hypothetical protein
MISILPPGPAGGERMVPPAGASPDVKVVG